MSRRKIIFIFLISKMFQCFNSLVLADFISSKEVFSMILSMTIFLCGLIAVGFLVKKFIPEAINFVGLLIAPFLIVMALISVPLAVIFLAGIFLYALICAEAQVLQTIAEYKNIPRYISLLLAVLPVIFCLSMPQSISFYTISFYIISSVLVFFTSYSVQNSSEKTVDKGSPQLIWCGLIFIGASGLLNYLSRSVKIGDASTIMMIFMFISYIVGAYLVYMSIDEFLRRQDQGQ